MQQPGAGNEAAPGAGSGAQRPRLVDKYLIAVIKKHYPQYTAGLSTWLTEAKVRPGAQRAAGGSRQHTRPPLAASRGRCCAPAALRWACCGVHAAVAACRRELARSDVF